MKNILKIFAAFLICFLAIGCAKDEDRAVASLSSNPTMSADKSTVVLTKDQAAKNAVTFTFTNPSYGTPVAVSNTLQIAAAGTNFSSPKNVSIPAGSTTVSYTVQDLNTLLLNMGLPVNSASKVEVRLMSSLSAGSDAVYSNVIPLTVTPYALISYIYAPGAYQGWDPNTANTLVSANSNGIYIGYINFPAAGSEFKITTDRSWTNNYGSNDGATLVANGANIVSPGAGYYKLTVDMNKNTYNLTQYSMGVVGDINGWNAPDLPMTWNDAITSWTYTGTFPAAGSIKFRSNNSWTENYGGANGVITNDNIPVTAGTHTITFNPFAMTYTVQ